MYARKQLSYITRRHSQYNYVIYKGLSTDALPQIYFHFLRYYNKLQYMLTFKMYLISFLYNRTIVYNDVISYSQQWCAKSIYILLYSV